jgi:myo-inositol-1(or 4)-monophosphatase
MTTIDWNFIDKKAKEWIHEAADLIKASFSTELNINFKSHAADLVTNMDKEVEQFFIRKVNETFPDHRFLGEEGFGDDIQTVDGTIWIVDPIDGTMNFVHQQCNFAISVAIYHDGVGMIGLILDVVNGELFHCVKGKGAYVNNEQLNKLPSVSVPEALIGINSTWLMDNQRYDHNAFTTLAKQCRGTRSYGSAAIELAYVASGRLDAYITMRLSPWDFAAGIILIDEVGGVVSTVEGETINILERTSVLVGKPSLHNQILKEYVQK